MGAVESTLFADPTSFSFFQAVRLLERLRGHRSPVGHFGDPGSETVQFTTPASLAFPASEIQTLASRGSGAPLMAVNFLGLIGPQGVLPYWYTLLVAEQQRARKSALPAFLDIFQHRVLAHFYRAWAKAHPEARANVSGAEPGDERVGLLLRSIVGLGEKAERTGSPVPDQSLLYYAGFLGPHRRSAVALEQLVGDYFDVPAHVEQFVGAWYPVPDDSLCRVGDEADASTQLGLGAVAGDEVWDPQVRVRLRLGPLTRTMFDSFLPGGAAHDELRELTRLFADDEVDVEVRLVLARGDVPPCVLGVEVGQVQLGWSTWIRTVPFAGDADDTTLIL
jgi:type VI secretion system protein ImpH